MKIYNDQVAKENHKSLDPDEGVAQAPKKVKWAKHPEDWDEYSWFMPRVEEGHATYDQVFHHPAVREYVQSEEFINYIFAKLGNERTLGDRLGIIFIRLCQFVGPVTFFLIQIHVHADR